MTSRNVRKIWIQKWRDLTHRHTDSHAHTHTHRQTDRHRPAGNRKSLTVCTSTTCMSHMWMSNVIHMNESCHTYKWVMAYICMIHFTHWMIHVTHANESCHTYEWVMAYRWMIHVTHWMSHVTHWMSCVTHMKKSWYTYEWVTSNKWMSHVTHSHQSCYTYEWNTPHIWMKHATHMNESHLHTCTYTHTNAQDRVHMHNLHATSRVTHMNLSRRI